LKSSEIEKRIESNKLRLVLPRRPCLDPDNVECLSGRPPEADFPRYSTIGTHYSDLLNLDIKVPGEHRILNETFDAEIQMLHIHLTASRMGQIGLPVRAAKGGHNQKFQALLDQFQLTYEANQAACANNQQRRGRRHRRLRSGTAVADEYNNAGPYASMEEGDEVNGFRRQLQNGTSSNATSNRFDPYTDFLPTVFFYRYEGSSTEPPCMSMTWFVMTHPLIISYAQLRQVKRLIFTNVDESCRPTSVHNVDQSVARPIQPLGLVDNVSGAERPVMLCKEGNFLPDP
jgi:carbonic anhydrase